MKLKNNNGINSPYVGDQTVLPLNGEQVLIKYRERHICTDGRNSFRGEWNEGQGVAWYYTAGNHFPCESAGFWGDWLIPDDGGGAATAHPEQEFEILDWIGFSRR